MECRTTAQRPQAAENAAHTKSSGWSISKSSGTLLMLPHWLYLRFLNAKSARLLKVREPNMSDVIFVLGTVVFFGLGVLYLKGCERLK